MANLIGLVTDSSSQITPELVDRFEVTVVPMTVTIDDTHHLEGVDLDADAFYAAFDDDHRPEIATSQPSPGQFGEAYRLLADAGCDEIVSVHISESMSGTVGSATLAARTAPVPVEVIDTGSASFGVAICVWAAGVAITRGANVGDIRRRIENLVPRIHTAFMVGVPMLTERSGRASDIDLDEEGVPVLGMSDGNLEVIDRVSTVDDAIDVMSTYANRWGTGLTVAIGTSDAPSRPLNDRLKAILTDLDTVDEVIDYRIGPSVGAHTGPGTFGLFVFPTIT